jgi:hypothetical protein
VIGNNHHLILLDAKTELGRTYKTALFESSNAKKIK